VPSRRHTPAWQAYPDHPGWRGAYEAEPPAAGSGYEGLADAEGEPAAVVVDQACTAHVDPEEELVAPVGVTALPDPGESPGQDGGTRQAPLDQPHPAVRDPPPAPAATGRTEQSRVLGELISLPSDVRNRALRRHGVTAFHDRYRPLLAGP
jgi:hypothetical protein